MDTKANGGGMFLVVNGERTACVRDGNIWVFPPCMKVDMKSLATAVDYSQFRKAFGNMPHDKVVSLTKGAGVTLGHQSKHRVQLDMQHRETNQRAQHPIAVQPSRFSRKEGLRLVMDHIGSDFPRSKRGYTGVLTICDM